MTVNALRHGALLLSVSGLASTPAPAEPQATLAFSYDSADQAVELLHRLPDGDYVGMSTQQIFRLDAQGDELASVDRPAGGFILIPTFGAAPGASFTLGGLTFNAGGFAYDMFNFDSESLALKGGEHFPFPAYAGASSLSVGAGTDGDYLLTEVSSESNNSYIMKIGPDGQKLWDISINDDVFYDLVSLAGGRSLLYGGGAEDRSTQVYSLGADGQVLGQTKIPADCDEGSRVGDDQAVLTCQDNAIRFVDFTAGVVKTMVFQAPTQVQAVLDNSLIYLSSGTTLTAMTAAGTRVAETGLDFAPTEVVKRADGRLIAVGEEADQPAHIAVLDATLAKLGEYVAAANTYAYPEASLPTGEILLGEFDQATESFTILSADAKPLLTRKGDDGFINSYSADPAGHFIVTFACNGTTSECTGHAEVYAVTR